MQITGDHVAHPGVVALWLGGVVARDGAIAGCPLYFDPRGPYVATVFATTAPSWRLALPIPARLELAGQPLVLQAAAIDGIGAVAISHGLEIVPGR